MLASYLAIFLTIHAVTFCIGQTSIVLSRRHPSATWVSALAALLLLLLITTGASLVVPGSNIVANTLRVFDDRTQTATAAAAILSAGFALLGLNAASSRRMVDTGHAPGNTASAMSDRCHRGRASTASTAATIR